MFEHTKLRTRRLIAAAQADDAALARKYAAELADHPGLTGKVRAYVIMPPARLAVWNKEVELRKKELARQLVEVIRKNQHAAISKLSLLVRRLIYVHDLRFENEVEGGPP
jgi:hypothetical protein